MQVTTWYLLSIFIRIRNEPCQALLVSIGHIFMDGQGASGGSWGGPLAKLWSLKIGTSNPEVSNVLRCHSLFPKLLQIIGCKQGMLGNTFEDIWVSSSPSSTCLCCLLERSLTFWPSCLNVCTFILVTVTAFSMTRLCRKTSTSKFSHNFR